METSTNLPLINLLKTKSKQALVLYLEGLREACCLHRVVILCRRSTKLLIRTGQCFLLNGFIFLGSMFVLKSAVIPFLLWILPDQCSQIRSQELCLDSGILKFYSFLRLALIQLLYGTFSCPFLALIDAFKYNDIAKYGFAAMGRSGQSSKELSRQDETLQNTEQKGRLPGLGGVMIVIGEQVYSMLLLSFFFVEVNAIGFLPYIGKGFNFLLLSWMYKWNFSEVGLDKRLDFFESNWAFFAGFGSPCVLAYFFFSPLVAYGVMAILYPLVQLDNFLSLFNRHFHFFFFKVAGAEEVISSKRRSWKGAGFGRLPIFYVADALSMKVLSFFSFDSQQQIQDDKAL
ncbi:protein EI24-like [Citrus sinensis]|nr:protein EI24-like [Citrus sinensis]